MFTTTKNLFKSNTNITQKYFSCHFVISIAASMSERTQILSPDKDILIFKWVVHQGSQISNGSILYLYQLISDDGDKKVQRFKNTKYSGIVKKLLYKDGEIVPKR